MKNSKIRNLSIRVYDAVASLRELQDDAQETFDNRTWEWQESENGEMYSDRLSELEMAIDEIENGQNTLEQLLES
jgi:hypothetical protein|tara:strand:- start:761 stop:985 length:225 start_codon:yes stop_codon:yes gene_type:complete